MISNSIGARILTVVGLVASLALIGLVVLYTQNQRAIVIQDHKDVTGRMASSVIAGLGAVMATGSAAIAKQYAEDIKDAIELEGFSFIRPNGLEAFRDNATILQVNRHRGGALFQQREEVQERRFYSEDDPHLLEALSSKKQVGIIDESLQLYTVIMPIANEPNCHRCHGTERAVLGLARLSTSLKNASQMVDRSRNQATVVLIVVLILFLLMTYLFLRKVVIKPIQRVTHAMHLVEQGDLDQRVPELGQDELGQMARSFNAMTRKIVETYTGLELEQDKLTTIILNAGEGIVVTDWDGRIVLVNPVAEKLLGKSASKTISQGFDQLVGDPQLIRRLIEHPDPNYAESVLQGERYLSLMAARIHTRQGDTLGMAALIRDVTVQQRREAYLEAISYTDQLTGLLNRRSLTDILHKAISDATDNKKPLTLLMLDLDHFKQLNDNYGHDMGDRVLTAFGGLLKGRLRDSDYACRYGGEEFSVILINTAQQGAWKTAEDIRTAVSELQIEDMTITVSIGIAALDQCRNCSPEDLLKAADTALYRAKEEGRNKTVQYDDTADPVTNRYP